MYKGILTLSGPCPAENICQFLRRIDQIRSYILVWPVVAVRIHSVNFSTVLRLFQVQSHFTNYFDIIW